MLRAAKAAHKISALQSQVIQSTILKVDFCAVSPGKPPSVQLHLQASIHIPRRSASLASEELQTSTLLVSCPDAKVRQARRLQQPVLRTSAAAQLVSKPATDMDLSGGLYGTGHLCRCLRGHVRKPLQCCQGEYPHLLLPGKGCSSFSFLCFASVRPV